MKPGIKKIGIKRVRDLAREKREELDMMMIKQQYLSNKLEERDSSALGRLKYVNTSKRNAGDSKPRHVYRNSKNRRPKQVQEMGKYDWKTSRRDEKLYRPHRSMTKVRLLMCSGRLKWAEQELWMTYNSLNL